MLIAIAAAWGYFSDQKNITPQKPIEQKIAVEQKEEAPAAIIPKVSSIPPGVKVEQKAIIPPVQTKDDLPPLPANPYEQFMQNVQPKTDSLDSINNKSMRDDQIIRRNEYFEKLSQQLKDMQGETQPEAQAEHTDPIGEQEGAASAVIENSPAGTEQEQIGQEPGSPQIIPEFMPPPDDVVLPDDVFNSDNLPVDE